MLIPSISTSEAYNLDYDELKACYASIFATPAKEINQSVWDDISPEGRESHCVAGDIATRCISHPAYSEKPDGTPNYFSTGCGVLGLSRRLGQWLFYSEFSDKLNEADITKKEVLEALTFLITTAQQAKQGLY